MNASEQKGSAAVEVSFVMPAIALLLLITIQLFTMGSEAMKRLIMVEAEIAGASRERMSPNALNDSAWPCLEDIPLGMDGRVRVAAPPRRLGWGTFSVPIYMREEVVFVTEPICEL